ncbi:12387_t:CDS:2 [Ambispora gerdemannii]|uniref:12387_t:CDS:1 n=1 Tax=Ambispora gerdemannii TaxID=144530 RepID=A0A9N9D1I6_9GLOM|nr:12387_t:CDS:2 [Ambispora gerdemannii]
MTTRKGITETVHVLADFSITPIGVESSYSKYIAECQKILKATGLNYNLHASGTNLEGRWDQVMSAIRKCVDRLQEMGVARSETNIRISIRTDKAITMKDSVRVVSDKVEAETK